MDNLVGLGPCSQPAHVTVSPISRSRPKLVLCAGLPHMWCAVVLIAVTPLKPSALGHVLAGLLSHTVCPKKQLPVRVQEFRDSASILAEAGKRNGFSHPVGLVWSTELGLVLGHSPALQGTHPLLGQQCLIQSWFCPIHSPLL